MLIWKMLHDPDLALQSQHCRLAGDILDVKWRVARDKLILKCSHDIRLFSHFISPVLGLLQAEPSYSASAEPHAGLQPSVGSPSACLPSSLSQTKQ